MIIKNLFRIIAAYKFSLIKIIFFEVVYLIRGYKGNKFSFSSNDMMSDNFPCPYFFLFKINKRLKNINFEKFIDLGCGSGRVIDFFNKNLVSKDFVGIEYFSDQFNHCQKNFLNQKNIQIVQGDFIKSDIFKYNADCYFFNEPFKKDEEFVEFLNKIINFSLNKKNIIFIFVNYNENAFKELKKIQCVESYYIDNKKGYSIYSLKNNELK